MPRPYAAGVLEVEGLAGEHFRIVRKSKTQGYVVPPEWYEQARAAMGDPLPDEPPTEK